MTTDTKKMLRDMLAWATLRGKPLPKTPQGMDLLVQEYLAATQQDVVGDDEDSEPLEEHPDEIIGADEGIVLAKDGVNADIVDRSEPSKTFEDDWTRLLRHREEAKLGPNGEHLDSFDHEFQLTGKHHDDLASIAPFTRTAPPSATNAVLGGQAVITGTPLSNSGEGAAPNSIMICRWQGDDAESRDVVVTLYPKEVIAGLNPWAYAIVKFGTRGFLTAIEADFGQQFTVSGSYVSVEVAMDVPDVNSFLDTIAGPHSTAAPYTTCRLTASLSFGSVKPSFPVTRTIYKNLSVVAPVSPPLVSPQIKIPPYAKAFWWVNWSGYANGGFNSQVLNNQGGNTFEINLYHINQNVNSLNKFILPPNYVPQQPFPIPSDAYYVEIADRGYFDTNSFAWSYYNWGNLIFVLGI